MRYNDPSSHEQLNIGIFVSTSQTLHVTRAAGGYRMLSHDRSPITRGRFNWLKLTEKFLKVLCRRLIRAGCDVISRSDLWRARMTCVICKSKCLLVLSAGMRHFQISMSAYDLN